ncbi:unnamed protein product [Allacma fusca]|uniref:BTB domain-containing protein n=1 Tax=Allacma fusca TaxID=39272 RepID=A0A8J2JVP7_9HEXA|nr:unnamed protein product [Allacma fusca]
MEAHEEAESPRDIISGASSLKSFLKLEPEKLRKKPLSKPLTFKEKWSQLLFNEEFADVHIRVGTDSNPKFNDENSNPRLVSFPCHKLVLATNSPFFWNLFKNDDLTVIRFVEFSSESIRIFLRFLYTEELHEKIWSSHEILLHILELAQKFQVPSLKWVCVQSFPKLLKLTSDNVFMIWVRAREYEELELEEFALKYICENAEKLLSGYPPRPFLDMDLQDLKCLLAKDELQTEELILFSVVVEWASNKCISRHWPVTGEMMRRVLKDAIYLIRFPLMTTHVFTNIVIPKGLLTADDVSKILRLMYLPSQFESDAECRDEKYPHETRIVKTQFNSKPRIKPGPLFTVSRFGSIGHEEREFGDRYYSLRFSCNKSIALVGFGFYGPGQFALKTVPVSSDKIQLDFQVNLRKFDGSLFTFAIAHKNIVLTKDLYRDCHKKLLVNFEYPVTIQPNIWYHVQYRIIGPSTSTGHEATRKTKTIVNCKGHGEVCFQFQGFSDQPDENQLPDLIFKFF